MKEKPDSEKNSDADLKSKFPQMLIEEVKKLRAGVRTYRDSTGHNLCWHYPGLWNLLPEKNYTGYCYPPCSDFISRCVACRKSLEEVNEKRINGLLHKPL
ncbi:MAG: hypothetical protein SH856_06695 [Flavobacteriales bacterium]|nr:hypothetical protein [Flavobacteriales bacterium]